MINLLLTTILFALAMTFYYGQLPLVFFFSRRKKLIWTGLLLVLSMVPVFISGFSSEIRSGFSLLYLCNFFLTSLIVAIFAWNKKSAKSIFLLAHLPTILFAILYFSDPGVKTFISSALSGEGLFFSQNGVAVVSPDWMPFVLQMAPALLLFEMSVRLIAGGLVLGRVQYHLPQLNLKVPKFSALGFADWPVWLVSIGIAGLLIAMEWKADLIWVPSSLLLVMVPYYALRGYSVIAGRIVAKYGPAGFKSMPMVLQFFVLFSVLFFSPYVLIFISLLGLMDTWLDFRKKTKRLQEKGKTVWK